MMHGQKYMKLLFLAQMLWEIRSFSLMTMMGFK